MGLKRAPLGTAWKPRKRFTKTAHGALIGERNLVSLPREKKIQNPPGSGALGSELTSRSKKNQAPDLVCGRLESFAGFSGCQVVGAGSSKNIPMRRNFWYRASVSSLPDLPSNSRSDRSRYCLTRAAVWKWSRCAPPSGSSIT